MNQGPNRIVETTDMEKTPEKRKDVVLITISITAFNLLVTVLITPIFFTSWGCNLIPIFGLDISNCSDLAQNSISNFDLMTFIELVKKIWIFLFILMLSMFIVFYFNLKRKIPSKQLSSQFFFSFKTIAQVGFLNIFMTFFILTIYKYLDGHWKGTPVEFFIKTPDSLFGVIEAVFHILQAFAFIYFLFTPLIVLWSVLNFSFCTILFRIYYYIKD